MANTAVTLSRARATPLSNVEGAVTESTVSFKVLYTDINFGAGATDTVTVTLPNTPANWMVTSAKWWTKVAFAGPGGFTMNAGTAASASAFIAAASIQATGEIGGVATLATLANATSTTAGTLQLVFTSSTSGGPVALTGGEGYLFLNLVDLNNQGA